VEHDGGWAYKVDGVFSESIMTYSFFPKLGTAFIGQQAMQPVTKTCHGISYFCALPIFLDKPKRSARQKETIKKGRLAAAPHNTTRPSANCSVSPV